MNALYRYEFDVYLVSAQTMPMPSGGPASQIPHLRRMFT